MALYRNCGKCKDPNSFSDEPGRVRRYQRAGTTPGFALLTVPHRRAVLVVPALSQVRCEFIPFQPVTGHTSIFAVW